MSRPQKNTPDTCRFPVSEFTSSLTNLKPEDIRPVCKPRKRKGFSAVAFIRLIMLGMCLSVFLYSAYSIVERTVEGIRNDQLMAGLSGTIAGPSVVDRIGKLKGSTTYNLAEREEISGEIPSEEEFSDEPIIDDTGRYDALHTALLENRKVNSDLCAYINITGAMQLKEVYPVVHTNNNDYYLSHNFYHNDSRWGMIYIDYRNSASLLQNRNTIIYGHCMTDGSMFRPIRTWYESASRNYTAQNITIELITTEGVYVYKLFSAYRSEGSDFITVQFGSDSAYLAFLRKILDNARSMSTITGNLGYAGNYSYDALSRIITLSTCTNAAPDERYVVHAILTQIIQYD